MPAVIANEKEFPLLVCMFHHFILRWVCTNLRSGLQQHCAFSSCYIVTQRKQDLIGDTPMTAASVCHITQSPLHYPLSLLHVQIVMQLPRLPVLSRRMLCKRHACTSHKHVCCRCNIGKEECVCGVVQSQQTPDLGPPSATPPQLYLHEEHCHSEFTVQAVNQSKVNSKT